MYFESRNYLLVLSDVEDWVLPILDHLVGAKLRWKKFIFFLSSEWKGTGRKGQMSNLKFHL